MQVHALDLLLQWLSDMYYYNIGVKIQNLKVDFITGEEVIAISSFGQQTPMLNIYFFLITIKRFCQKNRKIIR